jgi:trk system potassium uptake protein
MINFRIIARVFSLLLIFEGFLCSYRQVYLIYTRRLPHHHFFMSALITIITGILVFTPLRNEERIYGNKEGYIIVTGIWIIFSLFGTLPYLSAALLTTFTDAFFESMSGFTTTGATIFTDVESMPNGTLLEKPDTMDRRDRNNLHIIFSISNRKSINIQIAAY